MKKLRVLLADDHEIMRDGLKLLVNAQSDMEVVGEADSGQTALALARSLSPDIVLMDVSMPGMDGYKATMKLKQTCPQIKVLTLTRHTDEGYLQQLLGAGASGYVLKKSASALLIQAIREVVAGGTFLDPKMTERVVSDYVGKRTSRGPAAAGDLSGREEEVLRLVAWGYSSKEIAQRFSISHKTAEVHKANAMRKLGMSNRIDIVRYALLKGWLQDT